MTDILTFTCHFVSLQRHFAPTSHCLSHCYITMSTWQCRSSSEHLHCRNSVYQSWRLLQTYYNLYLNLDISPSGLDFWNGSNCRTVCRQICETKLKMSAHSRGCFNLLCLIHTKKQSVKMSCFAKAKTKLSLGKCQTLALRLETKPICTTNIIHMCIRSVLCPSVITAWCNCNYPREIPERCVREIRELRIRFCLTEPTWAPSNTSFVLSSLCHQCCSPLTEALLHLQDSWCLSLPLHKPALFIVWDNSINVTAEIRAERCTVCSACSIYYIQMHEP